MSDYFAVPGQFSVADRQGGTLQRFHIGIRFTELSPRDEKAVVSYVFQAQRVLLARRIWIARLEQPELAAQSRATFRIWPPPQLPVEAELADPLDPARTLQLKPLDISGGGMKGQYATSLPFFPVPCVVPEIRIRLPRTEEICCAGEVRWALLEASSYKPRYTRDPARSLVQ